MLPETPPSPPSSSAPTESRSRDAVTRTAARARHIGLTLGPIAPPFLRLATAAQDPGLLGPLLALPEAVAPGLPLKARGAHAIAFLSYQLAGILALLALDARLGAAPEADAAGLLWAEGDERKLHLRLARLVPISDMAEVGERLAGWAAPFIIAIEGETGLAATAQWKLVADSLALAFLESGRALGMESEGREAGLAILNDVRSLLFSPKTGFVRIIGQGDGRAHYFLERAGCCLAYQAPGGGLCDNCGLHPPATRRQRLAAHVKHEPPA
ncbi:(2Fe-2S)-binding protein [Rhizobium sp. YIM 134829]|uniref:(2Fe-2S)-binding protein n=1 Tax=Rhizobium sp. YIM 134829 TaxID=3390453 RepID=UPI0039783FA4